MKKTALITGASRGIGLETVRIFLARGFRVLALARDFSGYEFADHPDMETVAYDLQDVEGIPALVKRLGGVDVLINNAGLMLSIPYNEYPPEEVERILRINIKAPVALIREVAPHMIAQKSGRIVNNASISAHVGHPDIWYGITKAGLVNATKTLSKELGPHGILINAVAPSPVETDMLQVIPLPRREAFKKTVITGRFARPEEVAETMAWLGIDSPAYINGVCIDLNNGAYPR